MALLLSIPVRACIDLPDAEIRQLDIYRMKDPSAAERIAREKLSQRADLTAAQRVQYHIVIAFAAGNEGRGKDARAALDAATSELAGVPVESPDRVRLARSIAEADYGAAHTPAEFKGSLARIQTAIRTAERDTVDETCLRLTRGLVEIALDQLELGVADQIEAYRTAQARHWQRPAAIAASGLALIFSRTGMYVEAEQMNQETIRYATSNHLTSWLSTAIYRTGVILAAQRRWPEAIEAFEKAQRMSLEIGDVHGAAELRVPICNALIEGGQIAMAEQRCEGDAAVFDALQRPDLAAASRFNNARFAHAHGRYGESLRIMNAVIGQHLADVPLRRQPEYYRQRAASLGALGQFGPAYRDLTASMNATNSLAQSDKIRAVAVQAGRSMARDLEESNRRLADENTVQRSIAERNEARFRLGVGLAFAGLLLGAMMALLFVRASRQRRALARQALIQKTLTDNLADSVMLLDGTHRVVFANRAPGNAPDAIEGKNLLDVLPADCKQPFLESIDRASRDRKMASFDVTWSAAEGSERFLEQRVSPVVEGDAVIGLTVTSSDVTEKRAIEQVLQMNARVLETIKEGVIVIDASRRIVFANNAIYSALSYSAGALDGASIETLSVDLGVLPERVSRLEKDAHVLVEVVMRGRDGSERLMAVTYSALRTNSEVAAVCVCHDITTQRLIERALAAAGTQEAEEVGDTLHEGLAQDLAGIAMLISAQRPTSDANDADREDSGLAVYLARAVARARKLGGRMSPVAAAGGSLSTAIRSLASAAEVSTGTRVRCSFDPPDISINRIAGDQVYRLLDEMVSYATERFNCEWVALAVVHNDVKLMLTLEWEGIHQSSRSREDGWLAREVIAYRSKLLGGRCEFNDATDQPYSISVSIYSVMQLKFANRKRPAIS